jgi:hypothetical protein
MVTRVLASICLLLFASSASSVEVAGIKFDETTQVSGAALRLNGAGLRKRVFFQVYAMGLYLPDKKASSADILALAGPKRVMIHMLRDVDAATFTEALVDGMRPNHDEKTMKALEPRIAELNAIMAELKEAKKGMAIALDWQPGIGTVMTVDGRMRGKPIQGEDFYRALLRIWVGEQPVQDDLKKALLGGS